MGSVLETVSYSYTDSSWADLLTSYNGKSITYDAIGNTLSDGTWTYTWARGRQLASQNDGTTTWSYTYDATGQRLTKSNGTLTYYYIYNDMQLMYMKVKNGSTVVCEMYFQYGQLGLMAIQYISSSLTDTYYVVTNAQGDVVALVDGSGAKVVEYTYDAWGKLTNMTGSKVGTVGKYNPIRYRGYVYDTETQLYYLNTRYYNPDMGRFINADSYASTGQGLTGSNMFAYCGNNPVNYADPTGESFLCLLFLIGYIKGYTDALIQSNYINNSRLDANNETTTLDTIIDNQNSKQIEAFRYGNYDAGYNGCEVIAVHNIKCMLGISSTFSDTCLTFQNEWAMWMFGWLGSNPKKIGKVLSREGISYEKVDFEDIGSGMYIISYWTDISKALSPIHTIAVYYEEGKYYAYNYGNKPGAEEFNLNEYKKSFYSGYKIIGN